jgi:hypothetical protein
VLYNSRKCRRPPSPNIKVISNYNILKINSSCLPSLSTTILRSSGRFMNFPLAREIYKLPVGIGVRGGGQLPHRLLGRLSQSGNICFTVGQYWLIIKMNRINSLNVGGNSYITVENVVVPSPPLPRYKSYMKL